MRIKNRWYRYSLQIFFFVFIGMIAINHIFAESGTVLFSFIPNVSLHAVCPFGGIESIISLVTAGTLVPKLQASTLVVSALVLVLTLVFGAVFCSFVCPLGTIQEWFGKIGKKIFKTRYNRFIPARIHNILRHFRYVSLAATILLTYNAAKLVFLEVDPYYAMYHFFTDEATIGGLIVLGITLVGSLFVERPWCKYACPYGAALGLLSKISIFKIKRKTAACNTCTLCDRQCPMNIEISRMKTIGHSHCIRCMDCVDDTSCRRNALVFTARRIKEIAPAQDSAQIAKSVEGEPS
ncbi:MAG: 4Fe-4S binding protein [Clostridia bacterium]